MEGADTLLGAGSTFAALEYSQWRSDAAKAPLNLSTDNAPDPAVELNFCCICGALLGTDPEDEIDGEGWGRDICGDCNRTKNDEALFGR